jgi:hypothetical protein
MTGTHHHTQLLLLEIGFLELFALDGLEPGSILSLFPEYLGLQA